jgi:YVTN family beta-propeller protein
MSVARLNGLKGIGLAALTFAVTTIGLFLLPEATTNAQSARFDGPSSSQPIALTADGATLAVANPDNNSVTVFDVQADRFTPLAEVPVQLEPNGVAFTPGGDKLYVANTVSGTVSVIRLNLANGVIQRPRVHIPVGVEPYGLGISPNGRRLYVANARSNSVSVIDTASDAVIKTIVDVGLEPRGIAVTNDGDGDDTDETVYVTQFLALPSAPGVIDGADDSKVAFVTAISAASNAVIGTVRLNPLTDSGFTATGDSLRRIPPNTGTFPTGAYPNQLNNLAIKGGFAFVPNTGASPNGPFRFDVNTQSLLSVFNTGTNAETGQPLNMHRAVATQTNPAKTFITQPWAIAFAHHRDEGFVVSAASNLLVKLAINGSAAAVQSDPSDPTRVLEIPTGKNPRGIVINPTDTRAYVMNYVGRSVTVVDLTSVPERPIANLQASALPTPGSAADALLIGKELFNTSIGEFDPLTPGGPPVKGRMSRAGWGACSTCHPNGLSDNVVWIFPPGPRRTIPLNVDFDQTDPVRAHQRALNWSASRDEEEDFEGNIRAVSGGDGLLANADGTPDNNPPLSDINPANGKPNTPRHQLTVRGIGAWDAIKLYEQFGIRTPISPVSKTEPDVVAGNALFRAANCQQCHGGPQWSSSLVRFVPPPAAGVFSADGEILSELRKVGTFDPTAFNEVRNNAAPSIGANGFNPPSLLGLFAFEKTFFHNGAADSLDQVLENVQHRSAGTSGVDTLTNPADRQKIAKFMRSIDASSPIIPLP